MVVGVNGPTSVLNIINNINLIINPIHPIHPKKNDPNKNNCTVRELTQQLPLFTNTSHACPKVPLNLFGLCP